MNSKRAKVIRKLAMQPEMNRSLKSMLSNTYKFTGVEVTDRHIYKYLKYVDNRLNVPMKEIFNVNQIRSTL